MQAPAHLHNILRAFSLNQLLNQGKYCQTIMPFLPNLLGTPKFPNHQKKSPFFTLPYELRLIIYNLVLSTTFPHSPTNTLHILESHHRTSRLDSDQPTKGLTYTPCVKEETEISRERLVHHYLFPTSCQICMHEDSERYQNFSRVKISARWMGICKRLFVDHRYLDL